MAQLAPPSYQDATRRQDWLEVVAPHIPLRDYNRLCRVSRRLYKLFAPLLWHDPIQTIRALLPGQSPESQLAWFLTFIERLEFLRPATRELVLSLDLRGFALPPTFSTEPTFSAESTINYALKHISLKLRGLRCILLDGHKEAIIGRLEPYQLVMVQRLWLLSVPGCNAFLNGTFLPSEYFRNLVYLDISDIFGCEAPWLYPRGLLVGKRHSFLLRSSIRSTHLPELRILKLRNQRMGDYQARAILEDFENQIWSMDLSNNCLTDRTLERVLETFPKCNFRARNRRDKQLLSTEGTLQDYRGPLGTNVAPWTAGDKNTFVMELGLATTFSHPDRYLVDPPAYSGVEPENVRLDGLATIEDDSASAVRTAIISLEGGASYREPSAHERLGVWKKRKKGITHLYLNQNEITVQGVSLVLRMSPGHIERFECDSMLFPTTWDFFPNFFPRRTRLFGIIGCAHLFRPVYSSNLQELRIHHSLVTQLLSVENRIGYDMSTLIRLWLAETYLLPKGETTYPQAFIPDMNPRLRSLTLTNIPRYSTGHLTRKLTEFLRLASLQERAIQDVKASTRRGPPTVLGLRHIRLEFDHNPSQEFDRIDTDESFSFFDSSWVEHESLLAAGRRVSTLEHKRPDLEQDADFEESGSEYLMQVFEDKLIKVWIGSGVPGPYPAVNEYMIRARDPELRSEYEVATPCHVAAGVPKRSCIFSRAWNAMLEPEYVRLPTRDELKGMRDVLTEIKLYRARTKAAYKRQQQGLGGGEVPLGAPHYFWTGTLEVSFKEEDYTDSRFWR